MSVLLQHQYFPSYRQLPPDFETQESWNVLSQMGNVQAISAAEVCRRATLSSHWSFMGEIVHNVTVTRDRQDRCWVAVRDRDGETVRILFINKNHSLNNNNHKANMTTSTNTSVASITVDAFDPRLLKKGHTIFIRYALQYWFPDEQSSAAVLVEDHSFHKVIPCTLDSILEAHRSLSLPRMCNSCARPCSNRCNHCKQAFYCSRACLLKNWERHKLSCRILALTAPVTDFNYRTQGRVPFY